MFCYNFSVNGHIDRTLAGCAQLLYGLKTLRTRGVMPQALRAVFQCTVVAKLTYAAPASFTNAFDRNRLPAFAELPNLATTRSNHLPLYLYLYSSEFVTITHTRSIAYFHLRYQNSFVAIPFNYPAKRLALMNVTSCVECYIQDGPKNLEWFWELRTLWYLLAERHVIRQKFPNVV